MSDDTLITVAEDNTTITVQDSDTTILEVAEQGIAGTGILYYDTIAEMNAVTGTAGSIAFCADFPDQHWKWSTIQSMWIPAF